MEHIRREPKAPAQSPAPRQLGFTIPDRMNHDPETAGTEVSFLNNALKEAISQGASYVHIVMDGRGRQKQTSLHRYALAHDTALSRPSRSNPR